MSRQKHAAEQITSKFRGAEVLQGNEMPKERISRELVISDATYYK
jgi:hypothetical protein